MPKEITDSDHVSFSLTMELDDLGKPKKIHLEAEPHEQEAANSALRTAIEVFSPAVNAQVPPPVQGVTVCFPFSNR